MEGSGIFYLALCFNPADLRPGSTRHSKTFDANPGEQVNHSVKGVKVLTHVQDNPSTLCKSTTKAHFTKIKENSIDISEMCHFKENKLHLWKYFQLKLHDITETIQKSAIGYIV